MPRLSRRWQNFLVNSYDCFIDENSLLLYLDNMKFTTNAQAKDINVYKSRNNDPISAATGILNAKLPILPVNKPEKQIIHWPI